MKMKKKLTVTIICIIIAAVLVGFIYDGVMTAVEKKSHPRDYSTRVEQAAQKYGVPEYIVFAVIKVESDFDESAHSSADAYGLMQITAGAFSDMNNGQEATPEIMLDINNNINTGTKYLSYLYSIYGNWNTAIAAYNAGPGNVNDWLDNPGYSSDKVTLTNIPFTETRNYVRRVNEAIDTYLRLYY